jgi:hypothetical protein
MGYMHSSVDEWRQVDACLECVRFDSQHLKNIKVHKKQKQTDIRYITKISETKPKRRPYKLQREKNSTYI